MAELDNYYNRSEAEIAKGYEQHMFRAGYVLQSAELNEIQDIAAYRQKMLGDALFKDGDIVRDARVVVDSATGAVIAESGAVYLKGAVRGVPPANFTIPVTGTVVIGIYLAESVVTEVEDPALSEPAVDVKAYGEPGAARLKVTSAWGVQGDNTAEFYPIYYADDGQLRAKEAPPVMDTVSQAIARYDIDSSGSNYVVEGLLVRRLEDNPDGAQVYNVDEGRARVNGFGITLANSRRLIYPATPEIKVIDSEPTTATTSGTQTVKLARPPARAITQVRITTERTVPITHATFAGGADPLPDTSVVQIMTVTQGGTTYVYGTDYILTGQTVDWSPSGNEPAPGSSYQCTYRYIRSVTPTAPTLVDFKVTGAVVGSLILTTYECMLPRVDRLCLDGSGAFVWVKGVSTDYNPVRPSAPASAIPIAQVRQNWDGSSSVVTDGVRTVPMRDIEQLGLQMVQLTDLVAQQLLISDLGTREAGAKKGIFVDPFLNDDQRDLGTVQTTAIVNGILTLPITPDVKVPTTDVKTPQVCAYTLEAIIVQNDRTGSMKINPYMAFAVPASPVTLEPAVDRWTETRTLWASDVTEKFIAYAPSYHAWVPNGGHPFWTNTTENSSQIGSSQTALQYLRRIDVKFTLTGFGAGETLSTLTFDGIAVTPVAQ